MWNILEGVIELLLVNAEHIKQVPGRKTDVKDAEWIAQLLPCGLLKARFVPEGTLGTFTVSVKEAEPPGRKPPTTPPEETLKKKKKAKNAGKKKEPSE